MEKNKNIMKVRETYLKNPNKTKEYLNFEIIAFKAKI